MKVDHDTIEIRHKGLFDLNSIYRGMRKWLRDREYDYDEKRYKDKVGHLGNDLDLEMLGELRVTEFVKFNVEIVCKFSNLKEFEAELGGEVRKVSNGQFFVQISGSVTFDYQERFSSPVAQSFLKFLVGTLLKNYYDVKYVDRFYYDLYDLQTLIKELSFMETASNAF